MFLKLFRLESPFHQNLEPFFGSQSANQWTRVSKTQVEWKGQVVMEEEQAATGCEGLQVVGQRI